MLIKYSLKRPQIKPLITLIRPLISLIIMFSLFVFTNTSWAQGLVLSNPLGDNVKDIPTLVANIIKAILGLTGSMALLIVIYGGFLLLTSAGSQEKVKKAKDMIMWAVIGIFVILASFLIMQFVFGTLLGSTAAE